MPEHEFPAWMHKDGRSWIIQDARMGAGLWADGWRFDRNTKQEDLEPVVEKRKPGRPRK